MVNWWFGVVWGVSTDPCNTPSRGLHSLNSIKLLFFLHVSWECFDGPSVGTVGGGGGQP